MQIPIHATDDEGRTPLHTASMKNKLKVAELLMMNDDEIDE